MGNFQSIRTRLLGSRTPDEEEGGSLAYSTNEDSSAVALLSFSSIYRGTKAILQKLVVSTKEADPSLPIQNPSPREPLLAPSPQICFRGDSSGLINFEEAQHENVGRDHVVSVPEIEFEIYSSRKAKEKVKRSITEKRIKHYSSQHNILLLGEGDFSFSACLAVAFGSAANTIATSLDSQAFLKEHYGNAMANIEEIRRRGGKVMHGINATKMANHELLRQLKFDRIIFNFPYAGLFDKTMPTDSQLRRHRKLVSKFLMNARNMIRENGEIHITHKTNGFHADFRVESIASSHGLKLIQAVKFKCGDYPGYNTKYGFGGDGNFDCNPSKTFKFGLKSVSP